MSGPRLTEPHHGPGYEPEKSLGPPWEDFEDAVRYFKRQGVADPTAMAGYVKGGGRGGGRAPNVARTTTPPVHPNCRSSTLKVDGEDVAEVTEVNISVDNGLTEKVRKAVEDAAEEGLERAKRRILR